MCGSVIVTPAKTVINHIASGKTVAHFDNRDKLGRYAAVGAINALAASKEPDVFAQSPTGKRITKATLKPHCIACETHDGQTEDLLMGLLEAATAGEDVEEDEDELEDA